MTKMVRFLPILLLSTACTTVDRVAVDEKPTGTGMYDLRATRANFSNGAFAQVLELQTAFKRETMAHASKLCPAGYDVLAEVADSVNNLQTRIRCH